MHRVREKGPTKPIPKLPQKHDAGDQHSSDVCFKCYREHLRHQVKDKDSEGVSCPQCAKPLDPSEAQKLASSDTYREYVMACCDSKWFGADDVPASRSDILTKRPESACNRMKTTVPARGLSVLGVRNAFYTAVSS
jgi:hypothetical protein